MAEPSPAPPEATAAQPNQPAVAQPDNVAPAAADTGSSAAPEAAPPQGRRVYKWTDAKGKTYYGDIRPNQVPDAATVPIVNASPKAGTYNDPTQASDLPSDAPPSAAAAPIVTESAPSEADSEDLTARFNAMANELAEQRLAPLRAQQELHRQDLERLQEKEMLDAERRAAEAHARALEVERDIQREAYAEQERQREEDRREYRRGHEDGYRPAPPPEAQPAPPPEPPRPAWKPKEIPPFQPKEVGVSR